MRQRIIFIGKSNFGPSDRFRLIQFIPYLVKNGINVKYLSSIPNIYYKPPTKNKYIYWSLIYLAQAIREVIWTIRIILISSSRTSKIFINRPIIPYGKIRFFEVAIFKKGIPIIFDLDDAIYLNPNIKEKVDFYLKNSRIITVGNNTLKKYALQKNSNVIVIPTVIDHEIYKKKQVKNNNQDLVFGWIGSFDSMRSTLPIIKTALYNAFKIRAFKLIIIADKEPSTEMVNIPFHFYRWSSEEEINLLKLIDIGLMPLPLTEFHASKCGAKLIQYMGIGIPSISSPIGVNREIVKHGINGFQAIDEFEWQTIVLNILNNKYDLEEIGNEAFNTAHENYSIKAVLPQIIELLG